MTDVSCLRLRRIRKISDSGVVFEKVDATFPLVYGGFTMLGNLKIECLKGGGVGQC